MYNYVVKQFICVLSSHVCLTYCSDSFINTKGFEKWGSPSTCQVPEQKHWELSLEIKGSEYISAFFLIFQFSLFAPYSCKSANKLAAAASKLPIGTTILFFSISSNCKI